MAKLLKGEPLLHKLAVLAKWVVFPSAMAAAVVFYPPNYTKPSSSMDASSSESSH